MQGLFATLDDNEPKWKLDSSRIGNFNNLQITNLNNNTLCIVNVGSNPGLGYRPLSTNLDLGSLIWFNGTRKEDAEHWAGILDNFLKRQCFFHFST